MRAQEQRRTTIMAIDDRPLTGASTECRSLEVWEWEGGALRADGGYQTLQDALRDRELAEFWRNSEVDPWRDSATPGQSLW
jgi:hypothetical protein